MSLTMADEYKTGAKSPLTYLIDNYAPLFYCIADYLGDGAFFAAKRTCKILDALCKKYATRICTLYGIADRFEKMERSHYAWPTRKLLVIASGSGSYTEMFKITNVRDVVSNRSVLLLLSVIMQSHIGLHSYLLMSGEDLHVPRAFQDVVRAAEALRKACAHYMDPGIWEFIKGTARLFLERNPDMFWAVVTFISGYTSLDVWGMIELLGEYAPADFVLGTSLQFCISDLARHIFKHTHDRGSMLSREENIRRILPSNLADRYPGDGCTWKDGDLTDYISSLCK